MSRLTKATDRLERAVARLDAASARRAEAGERDPVHEKLAEGLAEALQATQADYAAANETAADASKRVDAAIRRLKGLLRE